jgi:PRD1 phage membrane DNA delivery
MGQNAITGVVGVITTLIGVAIVAVILSKNSNTASVLTSGGQALSSVLGTALSPVSSGGNILGGVSGFGNIFNSSNNTLPVISL